MKTSLMRFVICNYFLHFPITKVKLVVFLETKQTFTTTGNITNYSKLITMNILTQKKSFVFFFAMVSTGKRQCRAIPIFLKSRDLCRVHPFLMDQDI